MSAPQGSDEWLRKRYGQHIGRVFGDLTFLRLSENRGDRRRLRGVFRCCCGQEIEYAAARIINQRAKSHCGCKTDRGKGSRTHGMRRTKEYAAWQSAKSRSLRPREKERASYEHVTMDPQWVSSFEAFYKHIGPSPSKDHQLDRIDTERGYEPGNVRWATRVAQQRNRRCCKVWIIEGQEYETIHLAAAANNVSAMTIQRWVYGFTDARRGTTTLPKEGCYARSRY